MTDRRRVLFLCTGNSCRSQMAEGWARHLLSGQVEACSAGVDPGRLDPRAVAVMAEVGVDIAHHRAKSVTDFLDAAIDLVVTVCDGASEVCPVFPGRAVVRHNSFDDPPRLAMTASSDEQALSHYRRVRDEIRAFVETLPQSLETLTHETLTHETLTRTDSDEQQESHHD